MKLHEIQQALEALGIYKKLDEIRLSAQKKIVQAGGMIYQSFISMIDTPSSYQGNAGKVVKVKSDETGLEFSSNSGTDWGEIGGTLSDQTDLQSKLDTKVDKITGKQLSTEDYTTVEKNKLSGIEAGAEVNVNADWNAISGDAQILNKPTIPSAQIQSDYNQTDNGQLDYIKNKPDLELYRRYTFLMT